MIKIAVSLLAAAAGLGCSSTVKAESPGNGMSEDFLVAALYCAHWREEATQDVCLEMMAPKLAGLGRFALAAAMQAHGECTVTHRGSPKEVHECIQRNVAELSVGLDALGVR